jgi:hypothetical protein
MGSELEDGACERNDSSERRRAVAPQTSWKKIDSGNRKQMHFWLLPKRMAAQKNSRTLSGSNQLRSVDADMIAAALNCKDDLKS